MVKFEKDFDLTSFNSYSFDAKCQRIFFPSSEAEIIEIYKEYKKSRVVFLGLGNNVILSKSWYNDFFIYPGKYFNQFSLKDPEGVIEAEAGADMLELSKFALENSLSGLEIFYDIPSSLGGAIVMNAGAVGKEIKDVLQKVRFLDLKTLQVKELNSEELGFSYRNSLFQQNADKIVLKAWLKLAIGEPAKIKEEMEAFKAERWRKQPRDLPNAGSVFKRPKGHFVGPMIEKLGLKGHAIGGAKISEKHAGFIVNFNNATGKDVIDLISLIQSKVKQEFGIDLEIEQKII